jgi:peptidoglycan/xylan/chitin deacetylase (PgdA/CDA1 family)
MSNRVVFSVDLEWFTHTPAYQNASGITKQKRIGLEGVEFILDALDRYDAKATFFVVSEITEESRRLVSDIADAGHEIASHSHSHRLLRRMGDAEYRSEIRESKEILSEITDEPVSGFRAPAFDFPRRHFTALADAGYEYDSSVVPSRNIPGWYGGQYSIRRPSTATSVVESAPNDVFELPIGVMPWVRLPLTGTWLRFFGTSYTLVGMKLLSRRNITPVLYVHPWELVDIPRIQGIPSRIYWRTGTWSRRAVERILSEPNDFVTASTEIDISKR